jgi:hypothetical protein
MRRPALLTAPAASAFTIIIANHKTMMLSSHASKRV